MTWEYRPALDAGFRAAMSSRNSVVFVCPPAPWAAAPLFAEFAPGVTGALESLVLVPTLADAVECAALAAATPAAPAYGATSVARATRLLAAGAVRTLVVTPTDAVQLFRASAIDLGSLARVVVGWPDLLAIADALSAAEMVLGEARDVPRIILTADPKRDAAFLERHGRRAPIGVGEHPPQAPVAPARYATIAPDRKAWAVRAALDGFNPTTALVWDPRPSTVTSWHLEAADLGVSARATVGATPVELAVATALPSAEALRALAGIAREVLVLVHATQLPYLQRLAHPLGVFRLPSESERAAEASARLRARLRDKLAKEDLRDRLLALAPLFDEYDPALVAAAATEIPTSTTGDTQSPDVPTWVALHLNAGRKDRLRPADIVGLLVNAVGLRKDQVGLIDLRDGFSVVYVRAEVADRARTGLDGETLKGRRLAARVDRA